MKISSAPSSEDYYLLMELYQNISSRPSISMLQTLIVTIFSEKEMGQKKVAENGNMENASENTPETPKISARKQQKQPEILSKNRRKTTKPKLNRD